MSFAGGPFTCYPAGNGVYASNGVYSTGGTYYTGGGIYQPVQQTGFGTQEAKKNAQSGALRVEADTRIADLSERLSKLEALLAGRTGK